MSEHVFTSRAASFRGTLPTQVICFEGLSYSRMQANKAQLHYIHPWLRDMQRLNDKVMKVLPKLQLNGMDRIESYRYLCSWKLNGSAYIYISFRV